MKSLCPWMPVQTQVLLHIHGVAMRAVQLWAREDDTDNDNQEDRLGMRGFMSMLYDANDNDEDEAMDESDLVDVATASLGNRV